MIQNILRKKKPPFSKDGVMTLVLFEKLVYTKPFLCIADTKGNMKYAYSISSVSYIYFENAPFYKQ